MAGVTSPTSKAPAATTPVTVVHPGDDTDAAWWRRAVIYQIYPRSWADSDGDGVGDLPAITDRLPYLRDLGVDAIWLSPFYRSPMNDAGYDVADYRAIDPLFGTLDDADTLIATAHELGLKVLVDLVPNHTSSDHAWFQDALAAGPGSPERDRYLFRDGRGPGADTPPNNWRSVFGGRGWTRVTEADGSPGQWYLHIFDVTQPDLNWQNPQVREEFASILRFWLDRGVDGFRVDVAHSLVKQEGLPDWGAATPMLGDHGAPTQDQGDGADDHGVLDHVSDGEHRAPMWDQDGVHEIYRAWREVLQEYTDPDRILCAEAWVDPPARLARYVRPDEMHQAFNFDFLDAGWHAGRLREVIVGSYAANDSVGAPTTWVLSNHDVVRHASRFGLADPTRRPNGIGAQDEQPDAALGLRRARAATALMLALPGSAYLYQGEELGLPEATDLPGEVRQDPTYLRTAHTQLGRDGCRIPMPWTAEGPSYGFGPTGATWLPQPAAYRDLAVDQQAGVCGSTLELYRSLLRLRHERELGVGGLELLHGYDEGVVAVRVVPATGVAAGPTVVLANVSAQPVRLPDGEVLVGSGPLDADGRLPVDTTVWLG